MKEKKKVNLKTELGNIYLTSKDEKFLSREEALIKELEIIENKEHKIEEVKMNNSNFNIYNLIIRILANNDWGLYFKGEPLQSLPIQDGFKMFKVNDVNLDELHDAVMREIEKGQSETWENMNSSQNSNNSTEL